MDFLTTEPKATSAARKTEPLYASPEASVANNGDLILRPEHLRLLDVFRQTLRSCKTDADRFQACADCRDNILAENAAFQYLVAEIETIMFEECEEYKKGKGKGWSKRAEESGTDAENWARFVGIAREGKDAIRKCLSPLRRVSAIWGKEKVQHYEWAYKGEKYCKVLGTASSQAPEWAEAVIKLNQLILRRMLMSRRRPLQESVNPIDQVDLENLKRWTHKSPYIKSRDHESVLLQYRKLTVDDLPDDCGFDKYGLVVRREFAATVKARPVTILPKGGHETSSLVVCSVRATARESESHRSMSAGHLTRSLRVIHRMGY